MIANGVRMSVLVCSLLSVAASGCATAQRSSITPGAAKKYIEKNITTQAEVIEIFGTPNVITSKDGYEMWVYDKVSSRVTNSSLGLGGLATGGGGGGFLSGGASATERSETTVMLIIYFDDNDTVTDYKISQTKF